MHKHLVHALVVLVIMALAGCGPNNPSASTPTPAPEKPELVGLADFHTHQFGYLGFGGTILSHSIDPTALCLPLLPHDNLTLRVKDLVRDGLFAEATEQEKSGLCYPTVYGEMSKTSNNLASQRMDTQNLKRAWKYGLRLIVMHAVNSEFLCEVAELARGTCPNDRKAIEIQIQAAKDLEAQIDNDSGGPGLGWYRIVYTPEQAREVIGQGKLAVVLGVEASNAFGCSIGYRTSVPGVPNLFGIVPDETAYMLNCGLPGPGFESFKTQEALALFDHYWQLGVRHFFPIHNLDGTAGGTSLNVPLLHADNNPSRAIPGDFFNRVPDIDRTIRDVRPPIQAWNCSQILLKGKKNNDDVFDHGRCNALGLTETGRYLITLMASHGAVIDIDHMSFKAKRELLSDGGILGGYYPVVSSHGGIQALNHGERNNEGQLLDLDIDAMVRTGSAFAPILPPVTSAADEDTYPSGATVAPHKCGGTSESFVQAYRYVVDKLCGPKLPNGKCSGVKLLNGKDAFVGVGFGTDFNAPVPVVAAPRFYDSNKRQFQPNIVTGGMRTGPGGRCYYLPDSNELRLTYPFTSHSPLSHGVKFPKSTTPWGNLYKEYDISLDGVAHIGMIPDFVEELYALKLNDKDLQPLWHGAEAYVRTWETSIGWAFAFNEEYSKGISEDCRKLRRELIKYDDGQSAADIIAKTMARWAATLKQLQEKGCHGFPEQSSSSSQPSSTQPPSPTNQPPGPEPTEPADDPMVCLRRPYLPQCKP